MKKEIFEIIQTNLQTRIDACKRHLDHIQTTEDLSKISIKEFIDLKTFCKHEQVDMTEIVMVDFYHVIGMGDLTITQRNKFLSMMYEYTSYRSDIKCISVMDNVEKLPKLPSRSSFKLHKLGDITLTSKLRGRCKEDVEPVVEELNVDDYNKAKQDDLVNVVQVGTIKMQGNVIEMKKEDVPEFIKILNPTGTKEKIYNAAHGRVSYCEIVWEWIDETHDLIRGFFLSNSKRDSVRDKLKAKGLLN